jgi:hypothetical protein
MKIQFTFSETSRRVQTLVRVRGSWIRIIAHGQPGTVASVSIAPEDPSPVSGEFLRLLTRWNQNQEPDQSEARQ